MKINTNTTIQKLELGVFEIRLSEAKVEIETVDKTWKHVYVGKTRPYLELVKLMATGKNEAIHILCNALYSTTMLFYDADFCIEWVKRASKQAEKMGLKLEEE